MEKLQDVKAVTELLREFPTLKHAMKGFVRAWKKSDWQQKPEPLDPRHQLLSQRHQGFHRRALQQEEQHSCKGREALMLRTPKRLLRHLLEAMMMSKNPTIGVSTKIGRHGKGSIYAQGSGCLLRQARIVHLIPMMFSQNG